MFDKTRVMALSKAVMDGSLQPELLASARRRDRLPYLLPPTSDAIVSQQLLDVRQGPRSRGCGVLVQEVSPSFQLEAI